MAENIEDMSAEQIAAALADLLRLHAIDPALRSDTQKCLDGRWYRSDLILSTRGVLGTPIFDTLAYEYTLARELAGDERQAPVFLPED
ncbi:hypothetical protein SEA_A3WALLY_369 [Microbacterium phage A3Wally]|nr:hypothetical protein SEA_A3WALLY_16 [Microbacterium phage A3Wally]QWY84176.1 hypothetical protein SEA_A3WALLY_369 [Microbacterium phage A3Wally]